MEKAKELGLTRSVGVSNFSAADLDQVVSSASSPPVVNQVQFSPVEYRRGLLEAAGRHGIALESYSPLGTGRHLQDTRVAAIAQRTGQTAAQVLIRWCLQRDVPVIPKSTHREWIAENAAVFDFTLSDEYMAALDALDQTHGTDRAREGW
jgi:diketogulonate reductase-like aldo/keto reductase